MGGSLSFTPNADSPTEPGKKSILTSEIEGVSADQLLDGIEKYVRDGKAVNGWESNVEITDKDGGVLTTSTYPQGAKVFMLWKFDKASNQVESITFPTPVLFERGAPTTTAVIKVHSEPVRIESWVNSHESRLSGPLLKSLLDTVLAGLDATVDTTHDTPSIGDSSKLSVASGPIEGKPVDADSFLDKYKQYYIDKEGASELPDGSLVVEKSNFAGLGATVYAKHMMNKDDNCVCIHDYGMDADMSDLRGIATLKAHKAPFRLELWRDEVEARRAGDSELKVVQPLVDGVLKALSS